MVNQLTKRQTPLTAIGTFVCCHCIIESAKNIIGLDFPEILQLETHGEKDDEEYTEVAIKCLSQIVVNNKLETSLFVIDSRVLLNHNLPGTLFIGSKIESMGEDETKKQFIERIKNELISLDLMKNKVDEDMTDDDNEHYNNMFDINLLSDIIVVFTEKENEDDVDDLDIGFEEGMMEGIENQYYLIQVALYKMSKKKKIKDLDYILEEIHNTIKGMDSADFKLWSNNYKKYCKKKLKKEQNIEGDNN